MPRAAIKERDQTPDLLKDVTLKQAQTLTVGDKVTGAIEGKIVAVKTGKGAKTKNAVAVAAPAVRPESKSLMEICKDAALNKNVDAVKMKALLEMAREEQARIDDRIFELAKLDVQNEIPPIEKDSWNEHTKSKWAKLEKISYVADPIIRRHGFSLSYGSADCPVENHYRIVCDVTHTPTGHKKRYWIDIGMDSAGAKGGGTKSLAQGSGSSATYARRFLKVMIFDINVIGQDFDGSRLSVNAPKQIEGDASDQTEPQTEKPKRLTLEATETLVKLIKSSGVGLDRFLEKYGLKAVIDLDPKLYDDAVRACNAYKSEADSRAQKGGK